MVNNNKWGFGVIVSLIVISLGIFLLVFYKNVTIEPQTVYTVYLDGRSIGNIVSKKSFEDYINVKEEELKNKYNVDTVYTPKGVEIKKNITYDTSVNSDEQIYNELLNKNYNEEIINLSKQIDINSEVPSTIIYRILDVFY